MAARTNASMGRTVILAIAMASLGTWILPEIAAHGQTPGVPAAPAGSAATPAAPARLPSMTSKGSRADCERYVGVFAGSEKDAALLKRPEVRALAPKAIELVTCNAVRADSDEPCKLLEKDAAEACRAARAQFHEMRTYPNGRSYMFDDRKYQECKQSGGMPLVVCDALRKALREGDPAACAMQADFVALCRQGVKEGNLEDVKAADCATVGPTIQKMLEGQCRALVNLDASACLIPGPHADGMAEQCRKDIESRQSYGKGLKELAKSDSAPDRELAKAALDDPDACKEPTKSAMDACLGEGSAPTDATGKDGGTDTTAPAAPNDPPPAPDGAAPPKG